MNIGKVGKVVASMHDKIEHVAKICLKQPLNHGLVLTKSA